MVKSPEEQFFSSGSSNKVEDRIIDIVNLHLVSSQIRMDLHVLVLLINFVAATKRASLFSNDLTQNVCLLTASRYGIFIGRGLDDVSMYMIRSPSCPR